MIKVGVNFGRRVSEGIKLNKKHAIRIYVREATHTDPRSGETASLIDIAKKLIHGAKNMPARDFLVDSIRENRVEVLDIIKGSMVWRFQGLTADMQYELATQPILYVIKSWLQDGTYYRANAPNAPFTIATKDGDVPLLDSGQLIDNIEAEYV